MAGFRTFATGEVLTAANVNDFLMKQSVMVFADAAARTAALGAEVAEGMLTYNEDTAQLEVFDGSAFVLAGGADAAFDTVTTITATDATFSVPALATPIVKVTVVGGGGGGGGDSNVAGAAGGTTTFSAGAGALTVSATGGAGGAPGNVSLSSAASATVGFASANGGPGGTSSSGTPNPRNASDGMGGQIKVTYMDLTGVTLVNVTVGAGGAGGTAPNCPGSPGGRGEVILEFKAA